MSRITKMFHRLDREERCGLIAYVTCGHPDLETIPEIVEALEEAGADAIELGVPFSDPIADGPVIQSSSRHALQQGVSASDCIDVAAAIRERSEIPIILFSYVNPLMRLGAKALAKSAEAAGIDAVLITDLPPEASGEFRRALSRRKIGMIFLASPTSSAERLRLIDQKSDGFVYYVSTRGVTGPRRELEEGLTARLDAVRAILKKPLAVGFGVSEHQHYESLRDHCDAVVIGSAIVRAIGEGKSSGAAKRAASVVTRILGR